MDVRVFSIALFDQLSDEAKQSIRMRQHVNIHQDYADPCQRLMNAIGIDSYIRPHRHSIDPKAETLFAIRGEFALVLFDDNGTVGRVVRFGASGSGLLQNAGVELAPGSWHTVLALSDGAILLEMKAGPFHPDAAKELAPWAPEEGSDGAREYLVCLKDRVLR